ncbi:MAG: phosphohydrolase [Rhodospirillaceae bacterium]|mgnify:CR=1 FL=1|nr:phosphohydrolase [Rhodospirillaceae bacterium]|tara:strand:- start:50 stop:592 length:543 start_codon:yes stop_codon:yes gene_type:complete
MSIIHEIKLIFLTKGKNFFDEDSVTQLSHALQCALHAENANETPEMITACLLHDIGHLISNDTTAPIKSGDDAKHEQIAVEYLQPCFNSAVTSPIRWHVDAKRYLCATDLKYFSKLSRASIKSLEVQGGPFTKGEKDVFEGHSFYQEAIKLRRWDDASKAPSKITPSLDYFLDYARQVQI